MNYCWNSYQIQQENRNSTLTEFGTTDNLQINLIFI